MTLTHGSQITVGRAKTKAEPCSPRRGIFWDARAQQFGCRVGYILNLETGQRRRDPGRRLGSDENVAVLKHAELLGRWQEICARWSDYQTVLSYGLPESLRGKADLSKPVWIDEVWGTVCDNLKGQFDERLASAITNAFDFIARGKAALKALTSPETPVRKLIPTELLPNIYDALAPSVLETFGVGPNAKPMSLEAAVKAYVEYKKSKIGLQLTGRRGGIKAASLLTIRDGLIRVLKLTNSSQDLQKLTHEKLEEIVDAAYRRWSPRTAFNTIRTFKALLDWADRNSQIHYRNVSSISEIFRQPCPETQRRDSYDKKTIDRLLQLKAACKRTVEKGGEDCWTFVLLALNAGMYQVDLAGLTYANLKLEDGRPYLWWQREKELHHNPNLWTRHDLWPEVWERMQQIIVPQSEAFNPTNRLFLSSRGTELRRVGEDRGKTCLISLRYRRARENSLDEQGNPADLDLPFQQLRKIAMNAVKQFSGGSDDVVRKFAGQKITGVLGRYLADSDFTDVGSAVAKWGRKLREDGIL